MISTDTARKIDIVVASQDDYGRPRPGTVALTPCKVNQHMSPGSILRKFLPNNKVEFSSDCCPLNIGLGPTSIFFQTVHYCFANHHALMISPEVLFYMVSNEIATHVKLNPEANRHLFTTSAEREIIRVEDDTLVLGEPSQWNRTIPMFEEALRDRIPSDLMDVLLAKFSTSTEVTNITSLISFMDAASPYYDFRVRTKCGIPQVVLRGTPDDYTNLYMVVETLSGAFSGLEAFFNRLIPTLKKLAEQANPENPVDNEWWTSLYKYHSGSGSQVWNGWISDFVAHTTDADKNLVPRDFTKQSWGARDEFGVIQVGETSTHVSNVNFLWEYLGREIPMKFVAGILDLQVVDGALCPALSYAVVHA